MGPALFCALAPEVHGNTSLFQQQRKKKKIPMIAGEVIHTINKHEVKASLFVSC